MKRRDFLRKSLVAAGSAALGGAMLPRAEAAAPAAGTVSIASATTPGGFYTPNRAPLAPTAFLKLPVGSIKPQGWLAQQLTLQINGVCGQFSQVSDYLIYAGNGWVTPNSDTGWEEVTYWLRGLTDLGYVTGDQKTIALAEKWLKGMIASQQPDGWFGPKRARTSLNGDPDFWPHMPALYAIRSYQEVTGDPKVIPFLTNFFQFQNRQAPSAFSQSWAAVRWGDNIDSIYWLYNRTGDAFLIDLVNKIHAYSYDWTNGPPNLHNVNFAQGFREPAQYGVLANDPKFLAATERQYAGLMAEFGQMAGGGFTGDENARHGYRDPRQGFETCGIAEYMLSFQILTRQGGDPVWMDRCEELAFNMLPASYDSEQKSMHYITSMNSVQLDNAPKGSDFQNNYAMQAFMPGVHNYRCCPHNYGMAWPYYAENLWHATSDNGLAANLYAASVVTAKVGDGTAVTVTQTTEYPFGDTVNLSIASAKSVAFPLYLRIPRWCSGATVRVNGQPVAAQAAASSYLIINRTWAGGDKVSLYLPMTVSVRKWTTNQNAVSVDRGPLTYSLSIGEQWTQYAGTAQWPEYAVYPLSAWNYGLVLNSANPASSFNVVQMGSPVAANPFTHDAVPIKLQAQAKKIPNWRMDSADVIRPLQASPIRSAEATETVTLIPMGAARLRLTSFPVIGSGPDAHDWTLPDVIPSASQVNDSLDAMSDPTEPRSSSDTATPRFTWWDHKGTSEWIQYDYAKLKRFVSTSVYWYDDTGFGECRVPLSWRVTYKNGNVWTPVETTDAYGVMADGYNSVTFKPVTASALRVEVQLQNGYSGGVLRWRVGATDAAAQVSNGSFETPSVGLGGYQYNPAGAAWTFAGTSGIQANGSAWNAAPAADGTQTAFLQGCPSAGGAANLGSIAQSINFPAAGSYTLSFLAARREGGLQPLKVSVDGVQVGGLLSAPSSSFGLLTATLTISSPGSHTISLSAADTSSDLSTFVDRVSVAPSSSPAIANGSFETPSVGLGGYQYNPAGAAWTFAGTSGIQANGSDWNGVNAPTGTQTAFVQGYLGQGVPGSIAQSINFPAAGSYTLSFLAARREGGLQPLKVSVDGVQVGGLLSAPSSSFGLLTATLTISSPGSHTISLSAADTSSDLSTFVDQVSLTTS